MGKEEPCWMLESGHFSPCVGGWMAEIFTAMVQSKLLRFTPDAKCESWSARPLTSYPLMHTSPALLLQHILLLPLHTSTHTELSAENPPSFLMA